MFTRAESQSRHRIHRWGVCRGSDISRWDSRDKHLQAAPWDTESSPRTRSPGRSVDLGRGSGTNWCHRRDLAMLGKIFKVQKGEKYLSCTLQSLTVVPIQPEAKWHGSLINKTSRGQLFSIFRYRQGQATVKGRTRGHLAQEKHKRTYKGGLALRCRGSPSTAADFPPPWEPFKNPPLGGTLLRLSNVLANSVCSTSRLSGF